MINILPNFAFNVTSHQCDCCPYHYRTSSGNDIAWNSLTRNNSTDYLELKFIQSNKLNVSHAITRAIVTRSDKDQYKASRCTDNSNNEHCVELLLDTSYSSHRGDCVVAPQSSNDESSRNYCPFLFILIYLLIMGLMI